MRTFTKLCGTFAAPATAAGHTARMRPWLLKLHRWAALLFAIPLAVILVTGLVLSFEPWLVGRAVEPGSVTPARIEALLRRHDPEGRAVGVAYRSYDNTLTIGTGRGGTTVDMASGQALAGPSLVSRVLVTARRMHETLLLDAGRLVIASSAAMLALVALGVLMGWPRLANTLPGWHKATAWGLLPLIALSPLTGLLVAFGITFAGPAPNAAPAQGAPLALAEAVRVVGERHDLSALVWLRPQGPSVLARLVEGGEYRVYAVSRQGTSALPRNWPRLWHEGNFAGAWSAFMNVVASAAITGLLVTGVWLWAARRGRRSARLPSLV